MLEGVVQAFGAYMLRVATGYLTKKGAGPFNWKRAGKTLIFAVVAFGLGQLANVPPETATSLPAYAGITWVLEKWYDAVVKKVKDKKFKFLG